MKFRIPQILLAALCLVAVVSFVSCGDDDDKVSCSKLEQQISSIASDYYDAIDANECEELDGLYNKMVKKYKEAKNCKAFKDALDEMEMTYDEFMDELEEDHDFYVENCGEPV